ncbi:uncharacterized protein B0H18DRAFT_882826, partial [Fomitopsis serialis]|uniref:uncharacterized protein n=1 Tax=Fomitopsis serialis TaxID=139415 RepID=UPI002008D19B
RAIASFLEVCYLVRRSVICEDDIEEIERALERFRHHRQIFQDCGVRPTGFSLPRMHALDHYVRHIRQFGAPNGLCTSITESKHIKAVKEPWRRSSRYKALGQMLLTNQRLDKLIAARSDFARRGMLVGTCLSQALLELDAADDAGDGPANPLAADPPVDDEDAVHPNPQDNDVNDEDGEPVDEPRVDAYVDLARQPGVYNALIFDAWDRYADED